MVKEYKYVILMVYEFEISKISKIAAKVVAIMTAKIHRVARKMILTYAIRDSQCYI